MAIKVYISGVCGSQEVRKRQQRVLFVLTSMKIAYETVDITEPGRDEDREYMKEQCKKHNKESILPPQLFNDNEYCGDYSDFEVANDDDRLSVFLKLAEESAENEITVNGNKEDEEMKNEEDKGENENEDVNKLTNGDGESREVGGEEEEKEEETKEQVESETVDDSEQNIEEAKDEEEQEESEDE